jgi:hypothetical protein
MPARIARVSQFIDALRMVGHRNPKSWQAISSIGRAAGIVDQAQLDQAVADAVDAGLVERRIDGNHVLLTGKGQGAMSG